ncbi:MAG: citrate synthase [Desulfobacterales bacterium]|nr:citrate synthase [Desulfobacterales bacterium]MBF0398414.1 citrate synthase [Desulfobacterales bacterium]
MSSISKNESTNEYLEALNKATNTIDTYSGPVPDALDAILSSLDLKIDPASFLLELREKFFDLGIGKIIEALIRHDKRTGIKKAYLVIGENIYSLPTVKGTQDEEAIIISKLRQKTGYITLDPGFVNTGACKSDITFVDGEKGLLRYRGYDISELSQKSTFIETAMLLIFGNLPTPKERADFRRMLTDNEMLHEDLRHHFDGFPPHGEPMALLSAILNTMSAYEPELQLEDEEHFSLLVAKIMSKIRTIAANTYNKSSGHPLVYPDPSMRYCENFLSMMFSIPNKKHKPTMIEIEALEKVLILHADHEQNCSTSTVRIVGSSETNLFGSISAGVNALRGKAHGGANAAVIQMLDQMKKSGISIKDYIEKFKSGKIRLMGFGHRVYKNFDPRAKILKEAAEQVVTNLKVHDPLLDIAKQLEEIALEDDYFKQRKLYPNVDFYSGIVLKALKIPVNMFPVIFAIGRTPGWIAHWREQNFDKDKKIARPRQIYTGIKYRPYITMEERR